MFYYLSLLWRAGYPKRNSSKHVVKVATNKKIDRLQRSCLSFSFFLLLTQQPSWCWGFACVSALWLLTLQPSWSWVFCLVLGHFAPNPTTIMGLRVCLFFGFFLLLPKQPSYLAIQMQNCANLQQFSFTKPSMMVIPFPSMEQHQSQMKNPMTLMKILVWIWWMSEQMCW